MTGSLFNSTLKYIIRRKTTLSAVDRIRENQIQFQCEKHRIGQIILQDWDYVENHFFSPFVTNPCG